MASIHHRGIRTVSTVSEQAAGGVRAYAKHRDVNHNAVRKAIAAKRISRSVTYVDRNGKQVPRIEFALADHEWALNTDPTAAEKAGKFYAQAPLYDNESAAVAGVLADAPSQDGEILPRAADAESVPAVYAAVNEAKETRDNYLEHRARTEEFKAKQAELEYLKDLGRLVSAVEVREAQFRRDRTLRDKLLNVPDRIATIVAAERDPARVHHQMTDEIKRILNELSIAAAAEVAGGTPERVAA